MLATKLWCGKIQSQLYMNCDVHGHVTSYNLPVVYSYCNSFFIRDVHEDFGLINSHLFDILPEISSGKVGIFLS